MRSCGWSLCPLFSKPIDKNHSIRQKNQIATLKGMTVVRSWDKNLDTFFVRKIRPHPINIIWRKIRSSITNLFYCLELCEKQLLQAPNADVVILDSCCSFSSRVDNLYNILSTPGTTKSFWDTVYGSYYVDSITECRKS